MHNENTGTKKFFGLIIILLPLLMIPTILFGGEVDKKSELNPKNQADYVLLVKGDHISLKAKDASLKDILEEIGRRMNIVVVANIPREEKITIELDMLYLGDAIKRFKANYAYITNSKKVTGKITKIVVVPKGTGKSLSDKSEYDPQPSIAESEYDPQPSIQKFDHDSQPSATRSEHESQSSAVTEHGSQSSSTVIENESQSSSTVTEDDTQSPKVNSDYDPQPSIIEKN
jgi:hypothetical protein